MIEDGAADLYSLNKKRQIFIASIKTGVSVEVADDEPQDESCDDYDDGSA